MEAVWLFLPPDMYGRVAPRVRRHPPTVSRAVVLHATQTHAYGPLSPLAAVGDDRWGGGTYGYTPPEAVFGMCSAGPEQDAWALGHMLLLMLTKPQFRTSNMFMHSVSGALRAVACGNV